MKTERKIMAATIALGLTIWFIDAVQDYLFFYEGSFWDLLIANIPPHEFVIRAFWLVCVLLLGAVMTGFIRERQQREEQLTAALVRAEQRQAETAALLSASKEVLKHRSFADAARAIFAHSREIIGAPAGYISLSSEDGTQNEVVFLEAGGLPCAVDPATPMPIRGLRAEAYKKGQPIFDNHFSQSVHAEFLPEGHVKLENVLFAPLLFQEKAVGLLGLANKPGGFTGHDAVLASGFAELAAIALVTKRHEEERERLIEALETEKSFLRTVVEQMPAGVTLVEAPSGRFILGNNELKNIWHLEELPGDLKQALSRVQVFHEDGKPYGFDEWPLARSLACGETVNGEEVTLTRRDGSRCTLRVSSAPIRDNQGRVKAGVSACIDITRRKLAEEALRESEERLNLAIDAAGMGTFDLDFKTGEAIWSHTKFRTLGYEPTPDGKATLAMWQNLVHPDDLPLVMEELEKARRDRSLWAPEYRIIRADNGQIVWLRAFGRFHYDEAGEAVRFIGVLFDDTARKQAEEALRLRAEHLRFTFDQSPIGAAVVSLDHRYLRTNAEFCRLVGYTEEELQARTFRDITTPRTWQLMWSSSAV